MPLLPKGTTNEGTTRCICVDEISFKGWICVDHTILETIIQSTDVFVFFATAHSKGPCDGMGGTVKRLAAKASLQRPLEDQIQTPLQLFEWAKDAIPSATFQYIDKAEV